MSDRIELAIRDVIEEMQEAIIIAGGSFISRKELQATTVGDLLLMMAPNVSSFRIIMDIPKEEKEPS